MLNHYLIIFDVFFVILPLTYGYYCFLFDMDNNYDFPGYKLSENIHQKPFRLHNINDLTLIILLT